MGRELLILELESPVLGLELLVLELFSPPEPEVTIVVGAGAVVCVSSNAAMLLLNFGKGGRKK